MASTCAFRHRGDVVTAHKDRGLIDVCHVHNHNGLSRVTAGAYDGLGIASKDKTLAECV